MDINIIIMDINGDIIPENPVGSPRFRRINRVAPAPTSDQLLLVSIGNGPSLVRITKHALGTYSTISKVWANRRPMK